MEIGPGEKLAAYLALARQFVESCTQRLDITSVDQNTQFLIETLLQRTCASNKEDRALIRNLKALKPLIEQCNEPLLKSQSKLEETFRSVLLKCGFDASSLDCGPKNAREKKSEHVGESGLDLDTLKETGNQHFNTGEYQKALLYYDKLLSMPGVPNDLFVKVAGNKMLALLSWKGTTVEQMEGAIKALSKALQLEPKNAKLMYRMSQGDEWLGQLEPALCSALSAQQISPNDSFINKHVANLTQKIHYRSAVEHLDDRYRPNSEHETKENFNQKVPGFNMNFFEMTKDFPFMFACNGHRERDFNKDYVAAAQWYQKAADAGYPEGHLNLAALYSQGLGVELDSYKAVELLQQAVGYDPSMIGVAESYVALGMKYFSGIAVEQSIQQAKYWFQKAADLGFPEGELNMAAIYELENDFAASLDMLQSAAIQGCARAYHSLGEFYKFGKGVKIDLDKAKQMYEKALYYGFAIDVEEELAKDSSEDPLCDLYELPLRWEGARVTNSDRIEVSPTKEAMDNLEQLQNISPMAASIVLGLKFWQKAEQLVDKNNENAEQILQLFSFAIQRCSPFIVLQPKYQQYLMTRFASERMIASVSNQRRTEEVEHAIIVCGTFLHFPLSSIPRQGLYKCAYALARHAVHGHDELQADSLDIMIDLAISLEPHNVDLLFYKARVTESCEDFLEFVEIAPLDHYWRPRALYCIAEQFMNKKETEEVLKFYQLGLEAEKHQLLFFKDVECNEKNAVANYLISAQKLNRHPSLKMRVKQHHRKALLTHHQKKLNESYNTRGHIIKCSVGEQRQQLDPSMLSDQREYFLEDLDLTKECMHEGAFIDCLILTPPIKIIDSNIVVEDKKGITFRVLLYEDISLVHVKVGQWIRLYNPYVRIANDNLSALKVTNKKCFEVLQYEKICHCCTRVENPTEPFIACPGCQSAYYCSEECFKQHQNDFQHKIVCRYLNFDNNKKHSKK